MGSAASRLTIEEQSRVTDIFLSHAHLDHTKDIAFFAENVFTRVKSPVTVRGTADTLAKINENLLNNAIWPDFTALPSEANSILRYEALEPGKPLRLKELEVLTVPVHHPGGCVAHFFASATGTLLYTGDTGPTEAVWEEVNRRGTKMKAILLETSFPNRLQEVAEVSGHHTPQSLAKELRKIKTEAPVFVYHLKAPYRDETKKELEQVDDARIHVLEAGIKIEF